MPTAPDHHPVENLAARTAEVLEKALSADHGRHAELLVHDGPLRQSILALRGGTTLAEHNSPPAGSIQVLKGAIRVTGREPVELVEGEITALTHYRHAVDALADSVFLLTAVTSQHGQGSHSEQG